MLRARHCCKMQGKGIQHHTALACCCVDTTQLISDNVPSEAACEGNTPLADAAALRCSLARDFARRRLRLVTNTCECLAVSDLPLPVVSSHERLLRLVTNTWKWLAVSDLPPPTHTQCLACCVLSRTFVASCQKHLECLAVLDLPPLRHTNCLACCVLS